MRTRTIIIRRMCSVRIIAILFVRCMCDMVRVTMRVRDIVCSRIISRVCARGRFLIRNRDRVRIIISMWRRNHSRIIVNRMRNIIIINMIIDSRNAIITIYCGRTRDDVVLYLIASVHVSSLFVIAYLVVIMIRLAIALLFALVFAIATMSVLVFVFVRPITSTPRLMLCRIRIRARIRIRIRNRNRSRIAISKSC